MLEIIIVAMVLIADQVSKAVVYPWLATLPNETFSIIDGVFVLTPVENLGAGFGIFQNAKLFLILAAIIASGALVWLLIHEHKRMHALMRAAIALILAGALGNVIDRIWLGHVRDMFYFVLIDFPVFNVADSSITIGGVMLALDILFFRGRAMLDERKPGDGKRKDDGERA